MQTSPFQCTPPYGRRGNGLPPRCAPRNNMRFCSSVQKLDITCISHKSYTNNCVKQSRHTFEVPGLYTQDREYNAIYWQEDCLDGGYFSISQNYIYKFYRYWSNCQLQGGVFCASILVVCTYTRITYFIDKRRS